MIETFYVVLGFVFIAGSAYLMGVDKPRPLGWIGIGWGFFLIVYFGVY